MEEKRFNLLHEPWIRVLDQSCAVRTVSLTTLFAHAHEYRALAGELPTQDFAVLRFLLAVLYAVFLRYDVEGNFAPITEGVEGASPADALGRWAELYGQGSFPMGIIERYLTHYEERFYLIHPTFPFYQTPGLSDGTLNNAAKLNGELSESANKIRLFPSRTGSLHNELAYDEAARWLLYTNGFDDTSYKCQTKGDGSPGAGWMGKLGLVAALGDTLFETLMYNLVLLRDGKTLWQDGLAQWELEAPRTGIRVLIPLPQNPAQLLSLQSRRLLIGWEGERATSCLVVGGDYFPRENALTEPMTIWYKGKGEKNAAAVYLPRRHDASKQLWREFSSLVVEKAQDGDNAPGVVSWLEALRENELIDSATIRFHIASVQYGDKDFFVTRAFSDDLSFSAELLSTLGEGWSARIREEVAFTDTIAAYVGWFAEDLNKAGAGGLSAEKAREQFYERVDLPFRRWLLSINPDDATASHLERCAAWRESARAIARAQGQELVEQAGPSAMKGRTVIDRKTNRAVLCCAADAYNHFLYRLLMDTKGGKTQ